jgi:hypothetical protein
VTPRRQGEPKLAGETTACGKWRGAFQGRLARKMLHCRLYTHRDWRRTMVERHTFDVAFNLVASLHSQAIFVQARRVAAPPGYEEALVAWRR